jgi:hypothetical protein
VWTAGLALAGLAVLLSASLHAGGEEPAAPSLPAAAAAELDPALRVPAAARDLPPDRAPAPDPIGPHAEPVGPFEVRGLVVDARSGVALPRFSAALLPRAGTVDEDAIVPLDDPPADAVAGVDGRFAVAVSRPGRYALQVWSPDRATATAAVRLDARQPVVELRLAVEAGIVVSGRVLDPDGAPVAEAWVELVDAEDRPLAGATTGADGRFVLPPVAVGSHRLRVDSLGRPRLELPARSFDLAAPRPELELVLPLGAEIFGRVRRSQAGPQAEVVAVHESGIERRAPVDRDGLFRLARLSPGAHRVHLEAAAPAPRSAVLALLRSADPPEPVTLADREVRELRLEDPGERLGRLRVEIVGDLAPETLVLHLVEDGNRWPAGLAALFRAVPDRLGRVDLDGLPPGPQALELRRASGELLLRHPLRIAAGEDRALRLALPR